MKDSICPKAEENEAMYRILFIDSGNICCSVMAQYMMRAMVDSIGIGKNFRIDSASTAKVHPDSAIYPAAMEKLNAMKILVGDHHAKQMTWDDYDRFDLLVGMDQANIDDIRYIVGSDPDHKIYKLSSFAGSDEDIDDPWYTDDFDTAYQDIQKGLIGLLNRLS